MSGSKILPAILVMAAATVVASAQAGLSEPAVQACKASPGAAAPRGEHWYYRINRAKQHCWYLGQAGAHMNASAAAVAASAPISTPPRRGGDTLSATPVPTAPAMAASPVNSAQTGSAQMAPAQTAPAPASAVAEPARPQEEEHAGFVTRWPDNLPSAEDVDQQEPAMHNSYAEVRQTTDTTAQMPSSWPLAAAATAEGSAGDTALRYFSIAGMVAIPLLLIAGWAAKFARWLRRLSWREQWRAFAGRLARRRSVDVAPTDGAPAPATKPSRPDRWTRTPTDPAYDLKASLGELMRDLRRAGAFQPGDSAGRRAYQTKADAFRAALEPAE